MVAEFWPEAHPNFVAALHSEGILVPNESGKEILVNRRTKLRFDCGPDGAIRFRWSDPQLEKEWDDWVRRYS